MIKINIPKKYQKYFGSLEREDGLIDDCKYMLYFASGYAAEGEYPCMPVKSKKEALYWLRLGEIEHNYDDLKKRGLI